MWNTLIVDPMTNAMLFIYSLMANTIGESFAFGLAIIIFTILIRLVTFPFTSKSMKSAAALQELQKSKKWKDIEKKYKDDREKLSQEQMKLYQEEGINPFGSCLPTLIQFPIIIGMYGAITSALAATPIQLMDFARHIYSFFPNVAALIPLNSRFLWMDLSQPERVYIAGYGISLLAIMVFITSYLQMKLSTPMSSGGSDQGAQMGKMMSLYMPLFIGYLSWQYSSGLALYFMAGNVVGIIQYALMGRLDWRNLLPGKKEPQKTS